MKIDTINFSLKNGNCYKLLSEVPNNSIDLILTDPPYNIGPCSTGNIKFKSRKFFNLDIADWDHKPLNISKLHKEFTRILKPKGNLFVFTNYNLIGDFHRLFDPTFDTFQIFVWHKTNPPPKVRKSGFISSCELIICCWNKGHTFNFGLQKEMHNHFEAPICMGLERLDHPTQKPLHILKHIVKIASNPKDTVLDCFMGVGSTGQAAMELKRHFIGFEINKNYFDQAKKRLEDVSSGIVNNQYLMDF